MNAAADTAAVLRDLEARSYRWKSEALSRWLGPSSPAPAGTPEEPLSLTTLDRIAGLSDGALGHALRHRFIDLYLRERLRDQEAEMQMMTRGAAAHVNGHKVYLRDVIAWCQADHGWQARQLLQKETTALCRFLKPYLLDHWEESLLCLDTVFGYGDYATYCQEKKALGFAALKPMMTAFLETTRAAYFSAMRAWCHRRFRRPLEDLTRFDAIHLLGWGGFPTALPSPGAIENPLTLLDTWGMPLASLSGLHLHTAATGEGAAQGMTILLRVPQEVHIVMAPGGGWIDLETLWHELGHGLAAVFTPADLGPAEREFATDHSLSEAYAFLLQGAVLDPLTLTEVLGLDRDAARRLTYYKALRDLAVFRRYAAKFLWELELFNGLDMADGAPYASAMRHHTGFYHQPESHLFDLTPEFYCCDYLLGMMMAHRLAATLTAEVGPGWTLAAATGERLREWWTAGHAAAIDTFCTDRQLPQPAAADLAAHWSETLDAGPPS